MPDSVKQGAMSELREKVSAAFDAGFDSLCLKCQQGFSGEACPRCWPPTFEDYDRAAMAYVKPKDIYGWICQRLGATQDGNGDARRWFAVRDALSEAITKRGEP